VPYLNPQYSARYGTGRTASGRLVVQSAVDPILKGRLSQTSSLLAETALRAGDYIQCGIQYGMYVRTMAVFPGSILRKVVLVGHVLSDMLARPPIY
jgi:hypothetical protein